MTVPDYSVALDYILEAASTTSFDVQELASLLHLLKVVGLSAPEGMYTLIARCSRIVYRGTSAPISLFCLLRYLQDYTADCLEDVDGLR